MTENIREEGRLGDLVEIQKQSLKEIKALRNKKKDIWDIFSTLSTFLSAVVIAALGLYFTNVYNERASAREHQTKVYQTRILEMQTVEKFIPHLTGDEERRWHYLRLHLLEVLNLRLDSQNYLHLKELNLQQT